jgi:uncharacterized protein YndB with AHSA1/START domain
MICDILGVTRSGLYSWLDRSGSARVQTDTALLVAIRASFVLSDRPYGARRVLRDLHADGFAVGLHHVQRLLRVHALRARPRRRALPMDAAPANNATMVERTCDRELVVTRTINGPARLVSHAWTTAELFRKWWVPASYGLNLLSCEMDVRVGGQYRLVFQHEASTMEFVGTYLDVTPHARLQWTNDEGDAGTTITTVTFEERDGKTVIVVHDLYPSTDVLDSGAAGALPESLDQPEALLVGLR